MVKNDANYRNSDLNSSRQKFRKSSAKPFSGRVQILPGIKIPNRLSTEIDVRSTFYKNDQSQWFTNNKMQRSQLSFFSLWFWLGFFWFFFFGEPMNLFELLIRIQECG